MKATIRIMLKSGVLDPQGKAIEGALSGLGFEGVNSVRQGKVIVVDLSEDDPAAARASIDAMCRSLLANPVIETYDIDLSGASPAP